MASALSGILPLVISSVRTSDLCWCLVSTPQVDSIQKTNLYQRQQLLGRIMNDYDRTRNMMKERQDLQEKRKMANMHASLQVRSFYLC